MVKSKGKSRSVRFTDSEWRGIYRLAKGQDEEEAAPFIREIMLGLVNGTLKIVPDAGGSVIESQQKKSATGRNIGEELAFLANPPAIFSSISATIETNILLRKLVISNTKGGKELADQSRGELKEILKSLNIE